MLLLPAVLIGMTGSSIVTAATPPGPPSTAEPAIAPQARDALVRMTDYLRSLESFSVHEDITRDQVINGDLKVQKSGTAEVLIARKPDRARADLVWDDEDRSRSVFYDGKTLTEFFPAKNFYAQMSAPGTLRETVEMAQVRYGVEFPLADFLRAASGGDLTRDLVGAGYVGRSRVGGDEVEHYAYRTKDYDYQLWLETGDKPLPRKVVIVSKTRPRQPQFSAVLTWDLSPAMEGTRFDFTPPEGATKIPFGSPTVGGAKP
jgi:hypothetical protein